jgi:hypothetical protein
MASIPENRSLLVAVFSGDHYRSVVNKKYHEKK